METLTKQMILDHPSTRGYVGSLENPKAFLSRLDYVVDRGWQLEALQNAFPENFTLDQSVTSVLLNLRQDYDSIVKGLPAGFQPIEDEHRIHVGSTNQIGIYFDGEIQKGNGKANWRIACLSLHFRDYGNEQSMCIDGFQGELKEYNLSRREVRRVYGKLNNHFGENWQVGLLRPAIKHARSRGMEVKGRVPGIFYFLGDSRGEYPRYSLNYVRTYLRLGIPLEGIEFRHVPDEIQENWKRATDFLQTKDPAERLKYLDVAFNDYSGEQDKLLTQWLKENSIGLKEYEAGCAREFDRVFSETFN